MDLLGLLAHVRDIPRPVWSIVAGLAAGFGLTQRFRALLPTNWTDKGHEVATQALVFGLSYVVTLVTWGHNSTDAAIAAVIVGLLTPALWNVALVVIGWWKPDLRDALLQRPSR